MLYQLLTGRHPFEAGSSVGMLTAITTRHPLPPSRLNASGAAALSMARSRLCCTKILGFDHRSRSRGRQPRCRRTSESAARLLRAPDRASESELQLLRRGIDAEAVPANNSCVAGEPGNGKTTLVEDFLSDLAASGRDYFVGRGQCSERLAATEAYCLPLMRF